MTKAEMNDTAQRREVEANFAAFLEMEAKLLPKHRGEFALLRRGKIAAFYDNYSDAYRGGVKRFRGRPFSIQEVGEKPLDLGGFSLIMHGLH
jgi:hypothetical protein